MVKKPTEEGKIRSPPSTTFDNFQEEADLAGWRVEKRIQAIYRTDVKGPDGESLKWVEEHKAVRGDKQIALTTILHRNWPSLNIDQENEEEARLRREEIRIFNADASTKGQLDFIYNAENLVDVSKLFDDETLFYIQYGRERSRLTRAQFLTGDRTELVKTSTDVTRDLVSAIKVLAQKA